MSCEGLRASYSADFVFFVELLDIDIYTPYQCGI